MQEIYTMSSKELDKLSTIKSVVMCNLTQVGAAKHLGLSERQIRRLKQKYLAEGESGFCSKKRGKRSNREYSSELRVLAMNLIQEHFYDYGPTLAAEKLAEYFGIQISKETARQWMIASGLFSCYGVPMSFYSDKHGVFKVNHPEAKSGNGLTQFGRALKSFNVQIIFAHSPQAKGRVERVNATLQDRLVKELRFHKISDIETANKFLETFREKFNQRFAKRARLSLDLHRPISEREGSELEQTLSIQTQRSISKNMLVRHNKNIFKIIAPGQVNRLSQAKVMVCESLSGEITIFHKNQSLQYEVYKKGLHTDQIFNRKEIDKYLSKLNALARRWNKNVASL